jgi:predicted nucleic acid-binding protein
MLVPRLWHLEIANVITVNIRRGRCTQSDAMTWFGFLISLPIQVDTETERKAWSESFELARKHNLTVYDAAYLELAIRENCPLATLDQPLETAARAVGVPIFQP